MLLVIPSRSYFDDPATTKNRYFPVELAEAVLAHAGVGKKSARSAACFFWVMGESAVSASAITDQVKQVLRAQFDAVIRPRLQVDPWSEPATLIHERENESITRCNLSRQKAFLEAVGHDAKQYESVVTRDGELEFGRLVDRIKDALAITQSSED